MGTITVQTVLNKVKIILQDVTGVRWPDAELLSWANDGQRDIVLNKPDANAINTIMQLAAGTKQSLPTSAVNLLAVVRNMGADGNTPGRAVSLVDRGILDRQEPDWHSLAASGSVVHYCYDDRNPQAFYVYPPQPSVPTYVEVVYSAIPATVGANDPIGVSDIYANALADYVLYRAYSKDADYTSNAQRAMAHFQAFNASVGKQAQVETADDPNVRSAMGPFASTRPGNK